MHISLLPVCINQNVLDISDYGEFISEGYFFSGGLGVWWMGYGGGGVYRGFTVIFIPNY